MERDEMTETRLNSLIRRAIKSGFSEIELQYIRLAYQRISESGQALRLNEAECLKKAVEADQIDKSNPDEVFGWATFLMVMMPLHKNSDGERSLVLLDTLESIGFFVGLASGLLLQKLQTNPAAMLAEKRHAENKVLIAEAVKYWKENIKPELSAAKAANELVQVFPLSHKKLSEVVAAERKKQK